ncbi:unnamed protein product [Schistosoma margrebowiei]|uniref:Uncharacterized protein n=1 Tax=Schistosoma margrebowiei TaxID=48269 RepID=A0A183MEW6_9TREM|nr:unnamed protein product [Schistosoma margrebowiei]
MKDVKTRRGADRFRSSLGGCQDEIEAKETLHNWGNSGTKVRYRFPTRYQQTQPIRDNFQQQVPSLTTSTPRRENYFGRQLQRDQSSTNFKPSGGSVLQEASL